MRTADRVMPLYDYRCAECSTTWEAVLPIARRQTSCPDCLASTSPLMTFRGALLGLTTPGSATSAWDHRGTWGRTRATESPHLARIRTMLEDGAFKSADNHTRQSALTFSRTHELAKRNGMDAEARHIEGRMARLVEVRDREIRGEPELLARGVRRTTRTTRKRSRRGIEVTREIKYS